MKIIGLTGGIASGKTTVCDHLRTLGATVIDADAISRQLTAPGGEALEPLRTLFGDAVFCGDCLNRAALAQRVFSDKYCLEQLNALMHPMILKEMLAQTAQASQHGIDCVIWDVPLLFETGFDAFVDTTWLVALPEQLQLERVMTRDSVSREQAQRRIAAQMPLSEKRVRAKQVIENSATIAALLNEAQDLWEHRDEA